MAAAISAALPAAMRKRNEMTDAASGAMRMACRVRSPARPPPAASAPIGSVSASVSVSDTGYRSGSARIGLGYRYRYPSDRLGSDRRRLTRKWSGARWRFASGANRDAFKGAPAKYAPQYGGYCAWAVSRDYTYGADPEACRIVDGGLYLNYDKDVQAKWARELPQVIDRADRNWPAVLEKPGK